LRLLDHVAQCTVPYVVRQQCGELWHLPAAADFARQVARCPLRYVLTDELVRLCVELAYSQSGELCECLDLLHFPAEQLWIEWNEHPRREQLTRILPQCTAASDRHVVRTGILLAAHPGGRAANLRTFWLPDAAPPEPRLTAVETLLNLDGGAAAAPPAALFEGGAVAVCDPDNARLDELLACARFRLDPAWQRYYGATARTAELRAQVLQRSLTVAFDVPLLLALLLLLSLRAGLPQTAVCPTRLNAKRARHGKPALLEHLEVSCPVFADAAALRPGESNAALRRAARMHHVRGHLVRRYNTVFWRRPHWRGHARLGYVRSRTVELRPPQLAPTPGGTASAAPGSGGSA
jgi:hypothetical protein